VTIQAQILNLLRELKAETGTSLVFISHDLGVVSRIADRIVVMYAGEVVEAGTRANVLGNPRHPYTRALLECLPRPRSGNRGGHLGAIPGLVPSLVGPVAGCAFRTRCTFATPDCATCSLSLDGSKAHATLCHRADELWGALPHG
jgi:oligopeptide/dipeptide ABC transporter ATP-binding protein